MIMGIENADSQEWVRKGKEIVDKLEPDPMKVSAVMGSGEQVKTVGTSWPHWREGNVVEDTHGRRFHTIPSGTDQMFVARLLKGILPISDVVFQKQKLIQSIPFIKKKQFHSYEVPIKQLKEDKQHPYSGEEVLAASDFILHCVFHDYDHPASVKIENAQWNDEAGRVVLYDFDRIPKYFWTPLPDVDTRTPIWLRDKLRVMSEASKKCGLEFLTEMTSRLSVNEGGEDFVRTILNDMKRRGAGMPKVITAASTQKGEDKIAGFRRELLHRIEEARVILEE